MPERPSSPPDAALTKLAPFVLAGLAFACVLALDSRGMRIAVLLCCVAWTVALRPDWRTQGGSRTDDATQRTLMSAQL
jgi:hypothetical protein